MMKYAKIITLLLAVFMALSLSACGKKMSEEEMEEACVNARPSIVPAIQSGGLMQLKGILCTYALEYNQDYPGQDPFAEILADYRMQQPGANPIIMFTLI
jgi:hypothetical protein